VMTPQALLPGLPQALLPALLPVHLSLLLA
jgi:hypothetical protein